VRLSRKRQRINAQRNPQKQIEKDAGHYMDQDVDPVVAGDVVLMEIVIQRKAEVGHRPIQGNSPKAGPFNAVPCEVGQTNVGIVLNVIAIIKNKRSPEGVGIDQQYNHRKKKHHQTVTYPSVRP